MAQRKVALSEAAEQVRRVIDQLQSIHWQLLGIALSFPESAAENGLEIWTSRVPRPSSGGSSSVFWPIG